MNIVIFTVCKDATTAGGMLNISNGFSNLVIERFPIQSRFAIATRIYFEQNEKGRFKATLTLIAPDQVEQLRSEIDFIVPCCDLDATGIYVDSVGYFQKTFYLPGEYLFVFETEKGMKFSFPFYVSEKQRN